MAKGGEQEVGKSQNEEKVEGKMGEVGELSRPTAREEVATDNLFFSHARRRRATGWYEIGVEVFSRRAGK